jgi:hypothetical protein
LYLFKTAVYGFLAPHTKRRPRRRGKPFRVDVFITPLAYAEAAFLGTAKGRASVPKLVEFSVEVTDRKCTL